MAVPHDQTAKGYQASQQDNKGYRSEKVDHLIDNLINQRMFQNISRLRYP